MTKKQKLENNIKKVYLYQILGGIFFSIPVIVLFWQENGLSLTEIMVLQSIYAILAALLEVPTGYFADVYGRVPSLVIATVTSFFAIVVYSLGHNFAQFLVAEIFFAFAVSFASGTLSAFVYDTLKDLGREKEYKKIWGNMLSFGLVSLAISGIIGGFIGKIDLRYTMYLSIPFFAFMIPVVLSMQEPKRHKLIFKEGYLKQMFRVVYENIAKNQKLKWIIIYSGVIFAFNQSALWLYQPYLKLTGVDVVYFGIVF
ncbi:MAG: MFS transporter, partial [Patescibacteria group bacterium]